MDDSVHSPNLPRAARVDQLFARIARRYDLINDLQSLGLHRLWKRRLVRLTAPRTGDRALDLCCGTGDIARLLARNGARVVGLDFNQPMLEIAERKGESIERAAGSSSHFVRGDALRIPFPDDTFDIVTVGYGLRNLASWEAGLREMRRVAKPGGRLVALDFGKPENALWRGIYFGYLKFFVPLLGRIFCGDPAAYAYILESLRQYPGQAGVAAGLRSLGLVNVRIFPVVGGAMSIHYAEKPKT